MSKFDDAFLGAFNGGRHIANDSSKLQRKGPPEFNNPLNNWRNHVAEDGTTMVMEDENDPMFHATSVDPLYKKSFGNDTFPLKSLLQEYLNTSDVEGFSAYLSRIDGLAEKLLANGNETDYTKALGIAAYIDYGSALVYKKADQNYTHHRPDDVEIQRLKLEQSKHEMNAKQNIAGMGATGKDPGPNFSAVPRSPLQALLSGASAAMQRSAYDFVRNLPEHIKYLHTPHAETGVTPLESFQSGLGGTEPGANDHVLQHIGYNIGQFMQNLGPHVSNIGRSISTFGGNQQGSMGSVLQGFGNMLQTAGGHMAAQTQQQRPVVNQNDPSADNTNDDLGAEQGVSAQPVEQAAAAAPSYGHQPIAKAQTSYLEEALLDGFAYRSPTIRLAKEHTGRG